MLCFLNICFEYRLRQYFFGVALHFSYFFQKSLFEIHEMNSECKKSTKFLNKISKSARRLSIDIAFGFPTRIRTRFIFLQKSENFSLNLKNCSENLFFPLFPNCHQLKKACFFSILHRTRSVSLN